MDAPLVTVLMPAYNCGRYIEASIQAILNQGFENFEFIIVNDGSTDNTKNFIQSFKDNRIIYLENEKNCGIVKTLNKGLLLAKGKYILRTDADDIAAENMIGSLVDFMENEPDYIICGGNMQLIGGDKVFTYPSENDALKIHTLEACPFSHSTVIFKKEILTKNNLRYDESVQDGEDHALWSQLLPYGKFHNLESITLHYRESATQVTAQSKYADNYLETRVKIFTHHAAFFFSLNGTEVESYIDLVLNRKINSLYYLAQAGVLIKKILANNEASGLFNQYKLKRFLFIKWYGLCQNSYHLGRGVFSVYIKHLQDDNVVSKIKSVGNQFIKMIKA